MRIRRRRERWWSRRRVGRPSFGELARHNARDGEISISKSKSQNLTLPNPRVSTYRPHSWQRTAPVYFKTDSTFTPEAVAARWDEINDFTRPGQEYPDKGSDMDLFAAAKHCATLPANKQGAKVSLEGKVALVTGGGRGLGRAYCLLLAKLGAKVVVNDYGAGLFGDGQPSRGPADEVVAEIQNAGGTAVANYDSVLNGDKVVETAIKAFGTVHILINNAGVLRDKSFQRMSDDDWDTVYQVHMRGVYKVTKAVWPLMQKQNYGRIVSTSSPSGLYGK